MKRAAGRAGTLARRESGGGESGAGRGRCRCKQLAPVRGSGKSSRRAGANQGRRAAPGGERKPGVFVREKTAGGSGGQSPGTTIWRQVSYKQQHSGNGYLKKCAKIWRGLSRRVPCPFRPSESRLSLCCEALGKKSSLLSKAWRTPRPPAPLSFPAKVPALLPLTERVHTAGGPTEIYSFPGVLACMDLEDEARVVVDERAVRRRVPFEDVLGKNEAMDDRGAQVSRYVQWAKESARTRNILGTVRRENRLKALKNSERW